MSTRYEGTRWVSKDGDRQIMVDSEAALFCNERHFTIRNEATGHWRNISLSGLNSKFVRRSGFAPDYYGLWEKKKGQFKGVRVEITGYVTKVRNSISLSGRVVGTGEFFSSSDISLLTGYRRVEDE